MLLARALQFAEVGNHSRNPRFAETYKPAHALAGTPFPHPCQQVRVTFAAGLAARNDIRPALGPAPVKPMASGANIFECGFGFLPRAAFCLLLAGFSVPVR